MRGTANVVVGSVEVHSCGGQDGSTGTALHCNGESWEAVFWMIIGLDTCKQTMWYWLQPREKPAYSSCSSLNQSSVFIFKHKAIAFWAVVAFIAQLTCLQW